MKLNRMPEYDEGSHEEHEAIMYLAAFAANVPGDLHFLRYPKAEGDTTVKTWHMIGSQFQMRLVGTTKARVTPKDTDPSTANLVLVVGSQGEIPEGYDPRPDLYAWRKLPGACCDDSGGALSTEFCWLNQTQGLENFVWVSNGAKTGIYASIHYPVGHQFDCPLESPVNYALITVPSESPPQWHQDLVNDSRTANWIDPPSACPATPPPGYEYEYQGVTVVVDKVARLCTLPGLNDPVNPRDYVDAPTDVTLLRSTTRVENFVCTKDVIVAHTWRLVPQSD